MASSPRNCSASSKCDSAESPHSFAFCVMISIENPPGMYSASTGSNVRNVDHASSVGPCAASLCHFSIISVMDFSTVASKKPCAFRLFPENRSTKFSKSIAAIRVTLHSARISSVNAFTCAWGACDSSSIAAAGARLSAPFSNIRANFMNISGLHFTRL